MLSIGVEYKKTSHRNEWIDIIKAVRKVYKGKLIYSANWDEVEQVPFWQHLDYIGIQAYYPLPLSSKKTPSEVKSAWQKVMATIEKKLPAKPIVFTEVGYDLRPDGNMVPWKSLERGQRPDIVLRRSLIEGTLQFLQEYPRSKVVGAFWWKWMPRKALESPCQLGPGDCDFDMTRVEARTLIQTYWKKHRLGKN
ncbi:MAG: hypothetical protein HRU19_26830 [Pseudobacteriovorax sp.]|nr:hypothetical protein [Pseudobacteriovorax sp.]